MTTELITGKELTLPTPYMQAARQQLVFSSTNHHQLTAFHFLRSTKIELYASRAFV